MQMEQSVREGCERETSAAIGGGANGATGLTGGFDLLVSPYVRLGCLFVFSGAADLAFMFFFEAFVHNRMSITKDTPDTRPDVFVLRKETTLQRAALAHHERSNKFL